MKSYKIENTEKHPYKYFIEISGVTISTIDERKFNEVINQIKEKGITQLTRIQEIKLICMGFSIYKK